MKSATTSETCTATIKAKTPSFIDRLAKQMFFRLLGAMQFGQIVVKDGGGRWTFGKDETLTAHVSVHASSFYRQVVFGGSIGAGEAYIDHLWDVDDLAVLSRIMVLNMDLLDRMERGLGWVLQIFRLFAHAVNDNSRKGSKRNILAHYDLGNEMYRAFLDPTMMYSSAIYANASSTLEEASHHKLEIICKKLDLQATDRVIEIGSGWGGFAIHAARNYGCHVTTTTISEAQYAEAKSRIAAAGLADRITLLQSDYRDLHGRFDKLVSIEMVEAVGRKYLPTFFKKCGELLADNGTMLLQAITIRDHKYDQYARSVDFIQRHIFPGGHVPSVTKMLNLITLKTDMVVRSLEDFGLDYARTLRDWRWRFIKAFPFLRENGYDERFRRLWEFYLCYCEGGFQERSISVVHLVASRPGSRDGTVRR
ncbi:MAG: cyclopropane-fatty-acyl-phospholipid synthase family protein [Proteobacteria bacterium]|nr:cyclopropane-fatty-acyl-phospholipid synthase family protein [Pseudomonadota bacterium]